MKFIERILNPLLKVLSVLATGMVLAVIGVCFGLDTLVFLVRYAMCFVGPIAFAIIANKVINGDKNKYSQK